MFPHEAMGGEVLGVGIDLVEVSRISGVHERQGESFLRMIFTEAEQRYCMGMKNPYPHLSARFAAKEAAAKAFGTGIGAKLSWTAVSVGHGRYQAPHAILDDQAQDLLDEVGGTGLLLSLTHTDQLAQAIALVVRKKSGGSAG